MKSVLSSVALLAVGTIVCPLQAAGPGSGLGYPTSLAGTVPQYQQVAATPAYQYGATQYPGTQYPATQYPATQYPATQYPATQYPATQYPATQYPATQYPATQYPATQYPATQYPATQYPATQYPATQYPATQYPATQYPATQYPATQYPATQYPATQYNGATNQPGAAYYTSSNVPVPAAGNYRVASNNCASGNCGSAGSPVPVYGGGCAGGPSYATGPFMDAMSGGWDGCGVVPAPVRGGGPLWFGSAYGLVMSRDDSNPVWFGYDPAPPRRRYLSSGDADMEYAGGYETRFGRTSAAAVTASKLSTGVSSRRIKWPRLKSVPCHRPTFI